MTLYETAMRRFVFAALVALAAPLFVAAGQSPIIHRLDLSAADRAALDAVSAYWNGITALKGSFLQIEPGGNVDQGTFYILKPGKMRFEYLPPVPTLIVSNGSTVAVANTKLGTVDHYPLFTTPLDLILDKDVDLRHSSAFVGIRREPGAFIVELRSNQARTKANISLVFSDPGYELRQWTVIDNQGLATTVALRDLQPGADMPASLFVLPDKNSFAPRREE